MKVLVVVDMQRDFITGPLGNEQTKAVVPHVVKRIEEAIENGEEIIFTLDSHNENYLETIEGKNLPVPHCIMGTDGWQLIEEIEELLKSNPGIDNCVMKPTFGSWELPEIITEDHEAFDTEAITQITLIGVCTDICVVSNALLLKAFFCSDDFPVEIHVDARCCAGVTPESHAAALQTMKMCQIVVEGE